jgi:hypothetical protein
MKRQLQLTDRRMLWLKEQYLQLYFEESCCGPMTADAIRVGNICLLIEYLLMLFRGITAALT